MPSAWPSVMASLAAKVTDSDQRAQAAGRHRQATGPSAGRRHLRKRPVRRVQRQHRQGRARQGARAARPKARRSRFYLVGKKGRAVIRRHYPGRDHRAVRYDRDVQRARLRRSARRSPTNSSRCSTPASSTSRTCSIRTFKSALPRMPTAQQIIPVAAPETEAAAHRRRGCRIRAGRGGDPRRPAAAQPHDADLPRAAGERRVRTGRSMTAMDNATRNAGE